MRPLFHIVAKQKSSELFVLFVLLVTLGLAWVTELAGLSLALGAFLAGMLISETEYRYQVEDYIKPFRDVLLGFFFVTIGMLLDPGVVARQWMFVALVVVSLLAAEVRAGVPCWRGASATRSPRRCAARSRSPPRGSSGSCCCRSRGARASSIRSRCRWCWRARSFRCS